MSRVAIIDDHEVVAECLAMSLAEKGYETTLVLDPLDEDLLGRLEEARPDVCLIDLDLGVERAHGVELIPAVAAMGIRPVVFTGSDAEETLGVCLELGAVGVIAKADGFDRALSAIESALGGEQINSEVDKYRWLLKAGQFRRDREQRMEPFEALTRREAEVLGGLCHGLHVEEIAAAGFVSEVTVRSQVRAIFNKLGVRSQLAAVAKARQVGWTPPTGAPTLSELPNGSDHRDGSGEFINLDGAPL